MARCNEMLTLGSTVLQFGCLERVEVGGIKGKNISAAIKAVHADFTAAYERFQQVRAGLRLCGLAIYSDLHCKSQLLLGLCSLCLLLILLISLYGISSPPPPNKGSL
jgi:hypothetical protein